MITSRESVIYTVSGVFQRVFTMIASVVLRRLILPEQFGLWNLVQVIADLVNRFDLGSAAAVHRDLPLSRGRGDPRDITALQSSALLIVVLQGALAAAGVLAYWMLGHRDELATNAWVWVPAAAISLFQPALGTGQAVLQSHGRFARSGYLGVSVGLLSSACLLVGGVLGGVRGLILGGVVGGIAAPLATWVLIWASGIELRPSLASWMHVGRLLRYGVPLRVSDYPTSIFFISDSLVVAAFFASGDLALYATARLFSGVGYEVATRLTGAERNEWRVRVGRDPSDRAIQAGVFRLLTIQSVLVLPMLCLGTLAGAEVITRAFMPNYVDALPILRVIVVSWAFLPQALGLRDLWVVRGNFRALFFSGSLGLAVFGGGLGYLTFGGLDASLATLAWAFVLAIGVYITALIATTGTDMWGPVGAFKALAMLVVGALTIWLLTRVAYLPNGWIPSDGFRPVALLLGRGLAIVVPVNLVGWWLLVSRHSRDPGVEER